MKILVRRKDSRTGGIDVTRKGLTAEKAPYFQASLHFAVSVEDRI